MTSLRLHGDLERQRAECSWPAQVGDIVWVREDSRDMAIGFLRPDRAAVTSLGPYRVSVITESANPEDPWLLLSQVDTGKIVSMVPSWWVRKDEFLSAVKHAKDKAKP